MLTIGVFDGVHRGHAELIARAVKAGRSRGVPTVLMTFDPHPMEVVFPGSHPAQLTTLTRRAELVEDRVKLVEERLTALETRLETILSQVEDKLPEQARDLVKQARELVGLAA